MQFKLLILLLLLVALANIVSTERNGRTTQRFIPLDDIKHQPPDQIGQQQIIYPEFEIYATPNFNGYSQFDEYDSNPEVNKSGNGIILSLDSKNERLLNEYLKKPGRKQSKIGELIGARGGRNKENVKKPVSQVSGDSGKQLKKPGIIKELPQSDTAQKNDNKQIMVAKQNGDGISKVAENTRITEEQPKETGRNKTEKQLKENQAEKRKDLNKTNIVEKIDNQQLVTEENNGSENISKVEKITTEEGQKEPNDDGKESVHQKNQQNSTSGSDETEVRRFRIKKKCSKKRKSSSSSSSAEEEQTRIKMENDGDNIGGEKTKKEKITSHPERFVVDEQEDKGVKDNHTIGTKINTAPPPKSGNDQKVEPEIEIGPQSDVSENENETSISTIVIPPKEEKEEEESSYKDNPSKLLKDYRKFNYPATYVPIILGPININININLDTKDLMSSLKENPKSEATKISTELEENTAMYYVEDHSSPTSIQSKMSFGGGKKNKKKKHDKIHKKKKYVKIYKIKKPGKKGGMKPVHYGKKKGKYHGKKPGIHKKSGIHGSATESHYRPSMEANKWSNLHQRKYVILDEDQVNDVDQKMYKLVSVPFQEEQKRPYRPFKIPPEQVLVDNIDEAGQSEENKPKGIVKYILTQKNAEEIVNEIREHHLPENTDHKTFNYGQPEEIESQPGPDFERYDLPYVLLGNMFDKEGNLRPDAIEILKKMGYDSLVDQFYEDDVLVVGPAEETNSIGGSKMEYNLVDHSQGHEIIDYNGLQQNIPDITSNIVYTLNSIIGKHFIELSKRPQSSSDTNNVHYIVLDGENMVEEELQLPGEFPNDHSTTEKQTKPNILIETPSVTPSNEVRLDETSSDYKELAAKDYYYSEPLPYTHHPVGIYPPPEIVPLYPFDRTMNRDQYQGSLESANDVENALIVKPNSERTYNHGHTGIIREKLNHLVLDDERSNSVENLQRESSLSYDTYSDSDETSEENEYWQEHVLYIVPNSNLRDPRVQPNSQRIYNHRHTGIIREKLNHLDDERSNSVENLQRESRFSYDTSSDSDETSEENKYGQRYVPYIVPNSNLRDPRVQPNSQRIYNDGHNGIIREKLNHLDDERSNSVENLQRESRFSYDTSSDSDETSEENKYGQRYVPYIVPNSNLRDPRVQPNSQRTYNHGHTGIIREKLNHLDDERSNSVENLQGESRFSYDTSSDSDETSEENKYGQRYVPYIVPNSNLRDPRVQPNSQRIYNDGHNGIIREKLNHLDDERSNSVENLQRESSLSYDTYSDSDETSEENTFGQGQRPYIVFTSNVLAPGRV